MDAFEALKWGRDKLRLSQIHSFNIDTLLILQDAAGLNKEQIYFEKNIINAKQLEIFQQNIIKRSQFIPVAKIIGNKNFYHDNFIVNCDVLDPRPDSEVLIEAFLAKYPDLNIAINILEIGVGSGCLSLTLLKLYPNIKIYGVDISKKALNIAKKNADKMMLSDRINLIQSDIFANISHDIKFDEIISNPPYIPTNDIKKLAKDLKYDPVIALDGGGDGMYFYRKIADKSSKYLNNDGGIIVEIGINQDETIKEIFANNNFNILNYYKDLNKIIRVLSFIKK
ncbi:MAG: protein-(glutamine-N5) methyltransferase, release factor-specific [Rickettsiales bacterium]|nr:protein-(glutamine-N5) methyltransferase, release factor-specific [Rickettsiales bacterium]|tara:strand:+ start:7951 stop:8796 length:846 start_codon:yes stop_codon:yes gene_type:complete